MKKYHFQENEKDFGSTVRLDAINDKVKEIKKKEETDELGDANEFLNVFESEKFDDPAETDENTEDALVDTLEDADALEEALGETRRDGVFPRLPRKKARRTIGRTMTRNTKERDAAFCLGRILRTE